MHHRQICTVAQLLFRDAPPVDFAGLVADLQAAFARCPADERQLNWDHGDMAVLDVQGSRLIIGFEAGLSGDYAACLSVAVGYGPGAGPASLAARQDILCRLIVGRLRDRFHPDGTVWHRSARDLVPELLDALIAELPQIGADRLVQALTRTADRAATRRMARGPGPAAGVPVPANDQPAALHPQVAELRRVRAALYAPTAPSQPVTLRLAAHAMNATLVVIATPVGAAMMTYTLLRGENLQASARLLALVGLAIGARNTGVVDDLMTLL